ncbi:MAG: LamG domain-containing protein, partial [Bacteroidetes bacterium]|nr:LamG domain-containing protein [Bacteroidota bacterium]
MKIRLYSFAIILIIVTGFYTAKAQGPTQGLLAYWSFSGSAADSSGNGHNGTVNGATLTTDRFGNSNSAYYFDGNDYIDFGASSSLTPNNHTVNLWFKYTDDANSPQVLFNNTNSNSGEYGVMAYYVAGYGMRYKAAAGSSDRVSFVETSPSYADGHWHMLTGTYDTATNKLAMYIDECFVGYQNGAGTKGGLNATDNITYNPTEHWVAGAASQYFSSTVNNGPQYFKGSLDDIRIYNRSLSPMEIRDLYYEGITIYDTVRVSIAVTDTLYMDIQWSSSASQFNQAKVYPNPAKDKIVLDLGDYT